MEGCALGLHLKQTGRKQLRKGLLGVVRAKPKVISVASHKGHRRSNEPMKTWNTGSWREYVTIGFTFSANRV